MVFQRLDDARTGREPRLDREMHALALFPSELDAGRAPHNSVAGQMEAAALTDFPSEAFVQLAKTEPASDRVVQPNLAVAAGTSTGAIQVRAGRAAEPRRPRGTVVSPREMELRGGYDRNSPHLRALAGTARAIVITSVAGTLGTFIGIIAMAPVNPVFKPHAAPLQRQATGALVNPDTPAVQPPESPPVFESTAGAPETVVTSEVSLPRAQRLVTTSAEPGPHTISTDPVAAEQRLSVIERTSVEQASRKPAESRGAPPDRLNFRGALSVETDRAGAAIYVDGQLAGFTPITGWQVAVGSHVVRIELDGYQRWSAVIRVVADETNHLVARLSPIEQNED
jgi:hypothetical protein